MKNPNVIPINAEDIKKLDELILSKEMIFLDDKTIKTVKDFRDYIILVMENSKNKDAFKEKSFFYLIKKTLNNEENGK